MKKYRGYRLLLALIWLPAVFPPLCAGGSFSSEKKESTSYTMENNSVSSPRSEELDEPVVKRTDIKQLMETGVTTIVVINGKTMPCDVPGCTEKPTNFWYDSETGCRSCRCSKHK